MRVLIHCLIKANHTDKKWRGFDINRGQFISSNDALSKELGLTVSKIRTSIKKLILTGEIASHSRTQHTVFTVKNYESYQAVTSDVTNESQTDDKRIASTKNVKNDKNEKNSDLPPEKVSGKAKSKFKFSDEDMRFVNWMIPLIKNVSPKFKQPNTESWANTIRLMRESDKIDHKYMGQVFKWTNNDNFWKSVVLSPSKLREKFAALDAKRLSKSGNNNQADHTFEKQDYDEDM